MSASFFCLSVVCPRSFVVMGASFNCLAILLPKFILCSMSVDSVVPATLSSSESLCIENNWIQGLGHCQKDFGLESLRRSLYRCCGCRKTIPTNKQQVPILSSEPSVHCLNDPVSLSLPKSIEFSLAVNLRCIILRGGRIQVQATRIARPMTTTRTSPIFHSNTGFTNWVAKSL